MQDVLDPVVRKIQQTEDDLFIFSVLIADWETLCLGNYFVVPTIQIVQRLNKYARQPTPGLTCSGSQTFYEGNYGRERSPTFTVRDTQHRKEIG